MSIQDETLNMSIPVKVSAGNQTALGVSVLGKAYPVLYSEESGLVPTASSAQSLMYAEIGSRTSVAASGALVVLMVHEGPSQGYPVPAAVVSQEQPAHGTQWLNLGASVAVDPGATSIVLTTWTYASQVAVGPEGKQVFGNFGDFL